MFFNFDTLIAWKGLMLCPRIVKHKKIKQLEASKHARNFASVKKYLR